eukprot:PLAT9181.4.p1 GENE.PLAT9181.4~~PLAT9181.4.p1  ORF type:complete len:147 (-),score=31.37 PLAT9181.4:188-574(-)
MGDGGDSHAARRRRSDRGKTQEEGKRAVSKHGRERPSSASRLAGRSLSPSSTAASAGRRLTQVKPFRFATDERVAARRARRRREPSTAERRAKAAERRPRPGSGRPRAATVARSPSFSTMSWQRKQRR